MGHRTSHDDAVRGTRARTRPMVLASVSAASPSRRQARRPWSGPWV